MSIEYFFDAYPYNPDSTGEKDELNRDIVEEIFNEFRNKSKLLDKQKIFIFFDWGYDLFDRDKLASLIIKETPSYLNFKYRFHYLENEIPNFSDFEFIIYITNKVRERDDKIFTILAIAHEIQHLFQYLENRKAYSQSAVLKGYFILENTFTNEVYRNIPTEFDAFRMSKKIAIKASGHMEVNDFVKQEIKNAKTEIEKGYWENINSLDIEKLFDLGNEAKIYWEENKNVIVSRAEELKVKKEKGQLEIKEENFLEAFLFLEN